MFDLAGLTPRQREITQQAIDRCTFDFDRLGPELKSEVNKTSIPVDWSDLSRYAAASASRGATSHTSHEHNVEHVHVEVNGDRAHGVEFRHRVLGLAWYSGRISIDISLENDPELAGEVFLSEAAHMVDFFMLTDEQRANLYAAFHDGNSASHAGHDWFDSPSYWDDIGEALMGGFVEAYSNYKPQLMGFSHRASPTAVRKVLDSPKPVTYRGPRTSKVYHRPSHSKPSWPVVTSAGRRPCKICRPI